MPSAHLLGIGLALILCAAQAGTSLALERHYEFVVEDTKHTRLCKTNTLLTVNGRFPGPTIFARKGDVVYVNVINRAHKNITIHWHGIHQPKYPWSDGPVYVTQCPIMPGRSFVQKLILSKEEGTLWWHAHTGYDRWSLYGAIVIQPRLFHSYPFPHPDREIPIILGEWFSTDIEHIVEHALQTGGGIPLADALTINSEPGDFFNCSKEGTFKIEVEHGRTYLLRVINAAMDNLFFFAVAGHKLTLVGTDSSYVKPMPVDYIMISGGQTMDVLFTANQPNSNNPRYYVIALPFQDSTFNTFNKSMASAIVEYKSPPAVGTSPPEMPQLPKDTDAAAALAYYTSIRSLASAAHPVDVPKTIDERIFITVNMGLIPCPADDPCPEGFEGTRLSASLNNVSYASPAISILHAYHNNIPNVYTTDFPDKPPMEFNYTDLPSNLPDYLGHTKKGTKVKVIEYNSNVEMVLQGTGLVGAQTHPMHLHGYNFYVVGYGLGNFNEKTDPKNYNLDDPPYHNTVSVPRSGWTAIRFRADNPGVWFMHCHFERHIEWGMGTVFIVKDGPGEHALLPPPPDMPPC